MARTGAAALTLGLLAGACTGTRLDPPASPAALLTGALRPFDSCDALLQYVKANAPTMQQNFYGDRAMAGDADVAEGAATANSAAAPTTTTAPPAAGSRSLAKTDEATDTAQASFSTTNVQEKDVDEPDLVKTDGTRMVALVGGTLNVLDVTGSAPKLVGRYDFPRDGLVPHELLLIGDRVVAFGGGGGGGFPMRRAAGAVNDVIMPPYSYNSSSGMVVVDIADEAKPKRVATMTFEGRYLSARMANGVVRLVVHASPKGPEVAYDAWGADSALMQQRYQAAVEDSTVEDWLPTYTLERPGEPQVTEPLAPCAQVLHAKDFAGMSTVSVLTVDPDDPKPAHPACVLGGGETVYASLDSLVVATNAWAAPMAQPGLSRAPQVTALHQFAITGKGAAEYQASGQVDGTLLNQFALSEHEGRLRLATTVWGPSGTDNVLHVMERDGAALNEVGRLAGLGHEMESIHSVRFVGDRAYIVTFRRTDPLYVINLSDPKNPVKDGELQVPGFSSYLHPVNETKLLGVGQAPSDTGAQGLQVSLFDVADPAHPTRIDNVVFSNGFSVAQHDHHAFTWWPRTGQLFLPFSEAGYGGVLALEVEPSKGFGAKARVQHSALTHVDDIGVMRTVVMGDRLLSVADNGLLTSGLDGLKAQDWLRW